MRLAPTEPSFLDMRDAILLADQAATARPTTPTRSGPSSPRAAWATSRPREPLRGLLDAARAGRPARDDHGRRHRRRDRAGDRRGDGGDRLARGRSGPRWRATSGADGAYSIGGVPSRTYPERRRHRAQATTARCVEVTVPTGSAVRADVALKRNWASLSGGARALAGPGSDDFADQGCGPEAALDQLPTTAWSTVASPGGKSMVVALPQPVDVTDLALDPGEGCGDGAGVGDPRLSRRDLGGRPRRPVDRCSRPAPSRSAGPSTRCTAAGPSACAPSA